MKRIEQHKINKRFRRSRRHWALKDGTFGMSKKKAGRDWGTFHIIHVSKFGSKQFMKKFSKPLTPYASWYKMFGYKDLDELYQIIDHEKYRV